MSSFLTTEDGQSLEYRWDSPDIPAAGSVVFCHPHPEQDGTMTAPLMQGVTHGLVLAGFDVIRFNFRGVGQSTGTHESGTGEIRDIDAAITEAKSKDAPIAIAGWSFGAAMALRWLAHSGLAIPYAGIAPPTDRPGLPMPSGDDLPDAPRLIIVGERDQLIDVGALTDYAGQIGAEIFVQPGSDHFFWFGHKKLADRISSFLDRALL